ncbi:helix-turn-helix transcriptional regulator [Olleya sp. AH-315-K02]|nr:helix-turn-helix transcriptional regulator [Olleya sp. AH-315-K02]
MTIMSATQQLLSDNLKAIRKEKKLFQKDIADRSGILASTYSRIETMEVVPNLSSIEKIAEALEVGVAELFQSRKLTDKSLMQKMEMIQNLSEYNRNVVEILFDSIIEKDKLERLQEVKMKNRLKELERSRKKA